MPTDSRARNGHISRAPVHGYEALFPARFPESIAAREAFEREVLPELAKLHGGDLRPGDREYGRAWTLYAAGWAASDWHGVQVRAAEMRAAMEEGR